MKRLLYSLLFITFLSVSASAQTIVKDAQGNYKAVKSRTDSTKSAGKPTGATYTDTKGKISPVYISSTGRIYTLITSKSGKQYKKYIDNPIN